MPAQQLSALEAPGSMARTTFPRGPQWELTLWPAIFQVTGTSAQCENVHIKTCVCMYA